MWDSEKAIKQCFKPLQYSYINTKPQLKDPMIRVCDAILSIARSAMATLEPDYHYVWRLYLIGPQPHILNHDIHMQKQWSTYYE